MLRFRPAIWTESLDCYLEELYVVPARRGQGLGRALMEAAMELARGEGAAHMDLGTAEDDVATRRRAQPYQAARGRSYRRRTS